MSMQQLENQLATFLRRQPQLGAGVFIASGAVLVGDVTLGDFSSVWHNAVLRADINRIQVGRYTNIQDNVVMHLSDTFPVSIGDYVTVGHGAIVHACTIQNEVLIGMGSTILDGSVIGSNSLVGAQTLVPEGTHVPPGCLVLGVPGKIVRQLTQAEQQDLKKYAEKYARMAAYRLQHGV